MDRLVVVDIVVPEEELVRRLAARRICSKCGTNADSGDSGVPTVWRNARPAGRTTMNRW